MRAAPRQTPGHLPTSSHPVQQPGQRQPLPPLLGGEILGDTTVAAAMLDRLLHRSVVLNLDGDSYRLRDHHARTDTLRGATTGTSADPILTTTTGWGISAGNSGQDQRVPTGLADDRAAQPGRLGRALPRPGAQPARRATTKANVLLNLGREDRLDPDGLRRLVRSINRYLGEPDNSGTDAAAATGTDAAVDGLRLIASRPAGAAWLLDGLWKTLDVDTALRTVLGGRRFTTDVERVLFALVATGPSIPLQSWPLPIGRRMMSPSRA